MYNYILDNNEISEEIGKQIQTDFLSEKTTNNDKMAFNETTRKNKGLNPEYFSSNNSSIVNAINLLHNDDNSILSKFDDLTSSVNDKVGNLSNDEVLSNFNVLKEKTGKNNVIEMLSVLSENMGGSSNSSFGGIVETTEGLEGEENKIYFCTSDSKFYFWNGSEVSEISDKIEFEDEAIDFESEYNI